MRVHLVAAIVLLGSGVAWSFEAGAAGADVVIVAVEPDTYWPGESDETVVLLNQGATTVDLSGWRLVDSESSACTSAEGFLTFPAGASLAPGEARVVTANASAWRLDRRGDPHWEWLVDSDGAVPQLARGCGRFVLGNDADEVYLRDAAGTLVDAVVYGGESRPSAGWSGGPVGNVTEGKVLERNLPDLGGPRPDTDSAADWTDLRVTMIGQSHWTLRSFTDIGAVRTCASPDSSFATVRDFILGTRATLDVELYEWTNPHLLDAFLTVLRDGKRVRLLVEGGPVGFERPDRLQQNWLLDHLVDAGADVRFMITNASQSIHDRYQYLHQKTAIRDGNAVLVMSGNWKDTGLPTDPTYGNREWCIVVESEDLAQELTRIFEDDSAKGEYRDVISFGEGTDWRYLPPPADFEPDMNVTVGPYPPLFPAETFTSARRVTPVLTPDTSLLLAHPDALVPRMRAAEKELLVEQMTFNLHWGSTCCGSPETTPSPLLDAVVAAARNGARVRVLLGIEFIDPADTRNNQRTVDFLNALGKREGLDLEARLVDPRIAEFTKIHNKGIVIDRESVYVGSMNWGAASAQLNREIGLIVDGPEIAGYYREIFWYDWAPKTFKPLTNLRAERVTIEHDLPAVDAGPEPTVTVDPEAVPPVAVGPVAAPAIAVNPATPIPTRVVLEVRNTGTRGAGDNTVVVTVASTDGQLDRFTARLPHVLAGETLRVAFPWPKFLVLGQFTVRAEVDVLGEVPETDEGDNVVAGTADVLLPVPGIWIDRAPLP